MVILFVLLWNAAEMLTSQDTQRFLDKYWTGKKKKETQREAQTQKYKRQSGRKAEEREEIN